MADQTKKAVYELRIEAGPALRQFEQIGKAIDENKFKRTQLNKAITQNLREQEALNAVVKASGQLTAEQSARLKNLKATQEELNRAKQQTNIIDRGLSGAARELNNDLSGLTEKGLRFRDKMAEANLVALTGSGILGQMAAQTRSVETAMKGVTGAIDKTNAELEQLKADLDAGKVSQQQYADETKRLNAELNKAENEHKQLATEMDGLKAKSTQLEKEVLDLNAAFRDGKISQEQYTAGIKNIGDQTAQLNTKFDSFVSNQGQQLKSTLSGMALQYVGVGAAVAGVVSVVGNAIDVVIEFDSALASVSSLGGEYKLRIDALAQAARDMGPKFGVGATEAVSAIENLAKAGVGATDILGGGLEGALTLARAGSIGVAQAAEIAASAMTQFGLAGTDVSRIADLLSAGANKAQGGVGDLGAALAQAGIVAANTGVSIEESVGALSAFASAGLIGSDAGTSFKTMLQSLIPRSVDAAKAMKENGIEAFDLQGNFIGLEKFAGRLQEGLKNMSDEQRQATLKTIFGSDAVRAATVLYNEGAPGIAKWTAEVNQTGFAADVARAKQDTLQGSLNRAGAAWDNFILSLENGQGKLASVVRGSIDILSQFLEFFGGTGIEVATDNFAAKVQEGIKKSFGKLDVKLDEQQLNTLFQAAAISVQEASNKSADYIARLVTDYSGRINAIIEKSRVAGRELTNEEKLNITILRTEQDQLLAVMKEKLEVSKANKPVVEAEAETVASLEAQLYQLKNAKALVNAEDVTALANNAEQVKAIEDRIAKLKAEETGINGATDAEAKKSKEVQNTAGSVAALSAEVQRLQELQAQSTTSAQFATYQAQIDALDASIKGITAPPALGGTFDPLTPQGAQQTPQTEAEAYAQTEADITAQVALAMTERQDMYTAEAEAYAALQSAKAQAVVGFSDALGTLAEEGSAAAKAMMATSKAAAIADIVIKTQAGIVAAQAAAASVPAILPPGIPNPAFAIAQANAAAQVIKLKLGAAVSIATVLAQAISGFAEGGEVGSGGGTVTQRWGRRVRRPNGDNVLVMSDAGPVTLKTGEKVLNEDQQQRLERIAGRGVWGAIGLPGYVKQQMDVAAALRGGYSTGGTISVGSARGTALVNARGPSVDPNTMPRPSSDAVVSLALVSAIRDLADRPIETNIVEVSNALARQATIRDLTTA